MSKTHGRALGEIHRPVPSYAKIRTKHGEVFLQAQSRQESPRDVFNSSHIKV